MGCEKERIRHSGQGCQTRGQKDETKLSTEGRKRIREATKKRWALVRAAMNAVESLRSFTRSRKTAKRVTRGDPNRSGTAMWCLVLCGVFAVWVLYDGF